jgi:tetratricopeptide (TPR) repeat protein
MATSSSERLETLLRFLSQDPDNVSLLSDVAEAALAAGQPQTTLEMTARLERLNGPSPALTNLKGLALLQARAFDEAVAAFETLLLDNADDPGLRFNLAWSKAMLKDFDTALDLLNEPTTKTLPQAATLKVQLLHDRGAFEEAWEFTQSALRQHLAHPGLNAAASVLAIDMEDMTFAAQCAKRGGNSSEALTTLGTLALDKDNVADAAAFFDRALALNADAPRAWIGKGLVDLSNGRPTEAAAHIERGAAVFGEHIGSWIAAGWAQLLAGDLDAAKAAFEKAYALDDTFSESHGSLAVVALQQGRAEEAKKLAETAVRLDRQSFSGALANAMLHESNGRPELARKLIERALNAPIDPSGRTITQIIAKRGLSGR